MECHLKYTEATTQLAKCRMTGKICDGNPDNAFVCPRKEPKHEYVTPIKYTYSYPLLDKPYTHIPYGLKIACAYSWRRQHGMVW